MKRIQLATWPDISPALLVILVKRGGKCHRRKDKVDALSSK